MVPRPAAVIFACLLQTSGSQGQSACSAPPVVGDGVQGEGPNGHRLAESWPDLLWDLQPCPSLLLFLLLHLIAVPVDDSASHQNSEPYGLHTRRKNLSISVNALALSDRRGKMT